MAKRTYAVVIAVALALVATACAGDEEEEGTGGGQGQASTTQPEQPVRGGTLVVALDSDPGSLNPAITSGGAVHFAAEPMFNGLVAIDRDGKPTPDLATNWTVEQNGAVYRFTLRDGVKWHDGQPFTSDDVKFSFDNALLKLHSRTSASMSGAGKVTVSNPDSKTVVFTFPAPYAPLLQQLDVTEAPIIPKHVYESCTDIATVPGCPANKAPVGTGPFKFASYEANEIKLVRNPDYFKAGQPYLDGITERIIPDAGTRTAALQRHEVDWVWSVQGQDVALLRDDKGVTLIDATRSPGGSNCVLTVGFNLKPGEGRPPFFADLRTRQALWQATNRQQAYDQVLFGKGRVATQPIHTAIPFARTTGLTLPTFDANKAKQLLDQAGWKEEGGGTRVARGVQGIPDGTPFAIDFHGFVGQQIDYGQVLRQQWKAVGVEVDPKLEDNPTLTAKVFNQRAFDTTAVSYCNQDDPLLGVRRQYHSSEIRTAAFTNAAGYSNPEMDRLWDQSTTEPDQAKRQQIFQQIQELAVRDLPYIWLAETVNTRGVNSACTGFNFQNTGLYAEAAYCKR